MNYFVESIAAYRPYAGLFRKLKLDKKIPNGTMIKESVLKGFIIMYWPTLLRLETRRHSIRSIPAGTSNLIGVLTEAVWDIGDV